MLTEEPGSSRLCAFRRDSYARTRAPNTNQIIVPHAQGGDMMSSEPTARGIEMDVPLDLEGLWRGHPPPVVERLLVPDVACSSRQSKMPVAWYIFKSVPRIVQLMCVRVSCSSLYTVKANVHEHPWHLGSAPTSLLSVFRHFEVVTSSCHWLSHSTHSCRTDSPPANPTVPKCGNLQQY